jgi:hypothetical protein
MEVDVGAEIVIKEIISWAMAGLVRKLTNSNAVKYFPFNKIRKTCNERRI